jgi:hypothetical protein
VLSLSPIKLNTSRAGTLRDLRPLPGRRNALLRWLLLLTLLALVLLWTAAQIFGSIPKTLTESRLTGPRSPAPVGIVLLLDESGSFSGYGPIREKALEELSQWAPKNLRKDDTVTVISFAGDADTKMSMTTVEELALQGPLYRQVTLQTGGTSIQPALQKALAETSGSKPTSVIAVTDTEVDDADPSAAMELMRKLNATTMTTLVPSDGTVQDTWESTFGWSLILKADAGSPDQTALAIGKALSHATGQKLEAQNK